MATKDKKNTPGRLTEIIAYRRSQGGSVTGSLAGGIKERLKEKFDPRQLINQKGLMTALFPGLKTYQAKTAATEISKSSMQAASFDEIKPILETISFNTKMTAKNTMVLPALHRDVNVIRQNIVKLVKMKGGDARTKADMYFTKAKEREDKYERELKKERRKQKSIEKIKENEEEKTKSFLGKIFSTIIKGLRLVVESILKLGKAILGAFKFLASIVVDVISTIVKSLFNIAALLMPSLTDFLKNFFKKSSFIRLLFQSILTSVFRTMFSSLFLGRMAIALLPFLGAFFVASYGTRALKEQRLRENQGAGLTTEEEIRRLELLEKHQTLPKGSEEGKPMWPLNTGEEREKYVNRNESFLVNMFSKLPFGVGDIFKNISSDLKNVYHEGILQEFLNFSRTNYLIRIPGMQSPYGEGVNSGHLFFLTKDEASWWGKSQEELKRLFGQLSYFEKKDKKTPEEKMKMQNILDQISMLKADMLLQGGKLVNDQIKNPNIRDDYLEVINSILKGDKPRSAIESMSSNFAEDIMNAPLINKLEESVSKQVDDLFSPVTNLSSSLKENILGIPKKFNESVEAAKKEYLSPLIDMTFDNRKRSVAFKQPIVINQNTENKNQSPFLGLGSPASAWNNDFIDKHFSDMMTKNTSQLFGAL